MALLLRCYPKSLSPCRGEPPGQVPGLHPSDQCLPPPSSTVCKTVRHEIKVLFPEHALQVGDPASVQSCPFACFAVKLFLKLCQSGFREYSYLHHFLLREKVTASLTGSRELRSRGGADKVPGAPSGLNSARIIGGQPLSTLTPIPAGGQQAGLGSPTQTLLPAKQVSPLNPSWAC
jgi:hypothetical protein